MMNRRSPLRILGVSVLAVTGMMALLTGCGNNNPAPVAVAPPPPPPPPPPPAPTVTPVEQLMADLNIDHRVSLPEDKAPNNDADRKAVLVFFDAIARGNSQSLKGMLPLSDQLELNALIESGQWKDTTSKIQKIDVQTGSNSVNQKCALAVVEVGTGVEMSFQPQLWYYTTDQDDPIFEAAPTPPGIMDKLSGDWIAAWHQILADEMALAQQPDQDLTPPQKDVNGGESGSSGGSTGPAAAPTGPGQRMRDPNGPKIPAPG